MQILLFTFLGLLLFGGASGQNGQRLIPLEEGWKGIKVFTTDRTEVEKILGKPFEDEGDTRYRTDQALISVLYSSEPCSSPETLAGGFDIDRNTVIRYWVVPRRGLKVEDLEWQKHLYSRSEDTTHQLGEVHYGNPQSGISLTAVKVDEKSEIVRTIYFARTKEQDTKFACKKVRPVE